MINFFEWLSEFSLREGILYFFLLSLVLAIMPYTSVIMLFLRHIVHSKELKILHFEYSVAPQQYIGKDKEGRDIYIEVKGRDILINGTRMFLVWQVEGAYRIDLHPIKKNIKGNATVLLIDRTRTEFTLEAYGFGGKRIRAHIQLPIDHIYNLDVSEISSYHHLVRHVPAIHTTPISEKLITNEAFTKTGAGKLKNWTRGTLLKVLTGKKKTELNKALEHTTFLKGYSFSTAKYNELLQNNPNTKKA